LANGFPHFPRPPARTAASLLAALRRDFSPVIHLVKFPALTINHSMLLFGAVETGEGIDFQPTTPTILGAGDALFQRPRSAFTSPPNHIGRR